MTYLKAILFDMDGVIVDTELEDLKIQASFIRGINEEHARSSDDLDVSLLMGKSYGALKWQLHAFTGGAMDPDELWGRFLAFDKDCHTRIDMAALYRPETEEVLSLSERFGLRMAVVSSSPADRIEEVLSACGIRRRFDLIVSGELLERGKPDPTIYLNALEKLSFSPDECVAIEDSPHGIEAALGAGIRVIAYEETRVSVDQSAATWRVRDLTEAADIIRGLIAAE